MTVTLIGSNAARHWFGDFRLPGDVDMQMPDATPAEKEMFRQAGVDLFVDERLGAWNWDVIAKPEELYTMKVSHSFWEIGTGPEAVSSWNKHMSDVVFFQRKGVEFVRPLYDILVPIWKDIHGKKITNLNQNKDNFFKDAVKRTYDHDSLHYSVAYEPGKPLYEKFLKDGSEVLSDWNKFQALDHETKLRAVREEVYATALERILIPKNYEYSPSAAYAWALRRTVTSLFKNEWALFLVLNYDSLARPDMNYVKQHLDNKDYLIRLENDD